MWGNILPGINIYYQTIVIWCDTGTRNAKQTKNRIEFKTNPCVHESVVNCLQIIEEMVDYLINRTVKIGKTFGEKTGPKLIQPSNKKNTPLIEIEILIISCFIFICSIFVQSSHLLNLVFLSYFLHLYKKPNLLIQFSIVAYCKIRCCYGDKDFE